MNLIQGINRRSEEFEEGGMRLRGLLSEEKHISPKMRMSASRVKRIRPEESTQKQVDKWPTRLKVAALVTAGLVLVTLIKNYSNGFSHSWEPIMCDSNEVSSGGALVTCVPKNLLGFFNKYFPTVKVVGADSKIGQRSLEWFSHLGINVIPIDGYDKSQVPFEVWKYVEEDSVKRPLQNRIIEAWETGRPFTSEEKAGLDRLKGMAACYFVHQGAILNGINKYEEAVKNYNEINSKNDFPEKEDQLKKIKDRIEKYSSIFIFEHNARFGNVKDDGTVELSEKTAKGIEEAIKALPSDWEHFSLFVAEANVNIDNKSDLFSGTASPPSDSDILIHPGFGLGCKAYAVSHRFYPALKKLFAGVTEKKITRSSQILAAIDLELQQASLKRSMKGGRFQLGPLDSYVYRQASPSFHDKGGYSARNYPSAQYRKILKRKTNESP